MSEANRSIEVLVRFGELASASASSAEILHLLARAAIERLDVRGAVALEVIPGGEARVVSSPAAPGIEGMVVPAELIGPELADRLLGIASADCRAAHTLPLACDSRLFGALVLLTGDERIAPERIRLATGLVRLAAVALSRKHETSELERAFEEVEASRDVLVRTERLRALGQMATSVSHDLKNVFLPMFLHLDLCRRALVTDPSKVQARLDAFERVLRRGAETVERLRRFGKQDRDIAREVVDVNELVQEASDLCGPRALEKKARIEVELGEVPAVELEPGELVSSLVNVLMNAIDALPACEGSIRLRTWAAGGAVRIEIADNGSGMSPEVQARLFEPFFTTKGSAGTGLGLAAVYGFVERNRGTISVVSAPGAGTTFQLRFPAAARGATAPTHH